jgi:hypothetical protein
MRRKIVFVAIFALFAPGAASAAQSSAQLAASRIAASRQVINKPAPVVKINNIIANSVARARLNRQQEIDRILEILRNLHRPRPVSP